MNNASSVTLRSFSLCSRARIWPQPGLLLRRAFTSTSQSASIVTIACSTLRQCVYETPHSRSSFRIWTPSSETPLRRTFTSSRILARLKPYDEDYEEGLTFRDQELSDEELATSLGLRGVPPSLGNRLLKVLHARRVDGTLDIPLDAELSSLLDDYPDLQYHALSWLRAQYFVDEDAAIIARFQREEAPREQESPSALMERGQRLGLFKTQDQSQKENPDYYGPQSGQYYARLSDKPEDVFGRSELERIRAKNEAEAEEEERQLQAQIDNSMEKAKSKHRERSHALAERPEQNLEVSDGKGGVRPPNEFEKWIIRAQQKATSDLTLDSPEIAKMSSTARIAPSLLFVLLACGALYVFAQYWQPPRRTDRMFPNMSLSIATCVGITGINALVFVLWRFPPAKAFLNKFATVVPAYPYMLSMLGNTFSHFTFRHFLLNTISLFIFGPSLHEDIGRGNFLAIYLASGLVGSIVSLSSFVLRGVFFTTSMGASGCVWGVTSAYLWLHRDDNFSFIFIPRDMQDMALTKGWMLLGILVALDTIAGLRKTGIDVAAHLGGMVVGVLSSSLWEKTHGEVKKGDKPSFIGGLVTEMSNRFQK